MMLTHSLGLLAADIEASNKVFVYGTLKSGYGNHGWLKGASLVSRAKLFGYSLKHGHAFPAMYKDGTAPEERSVFGEIYQIDADILGDLDRLEGVPNHYQRILVNCGKEGKLWTYVQHKPLFQFSRVVDGNWIGPGTSVETVLTSTQPLLPHQPRNLLSILGRGQIPPTNLIPKKEEPKEPPLINPSELLWGAPQQASVEAFGESK